MEKNKSDQKSTMEVEKTAIKKLKHMNTSKTKLQKGSRNHTNLENIIKSTLQTESE